MTPVDIEMMPRLLNAIAANLIRSLKTTLDAISPLRSTALRIIAGRLKVDSNVGADHVSGMADDFELLIAGGGLNGMLLGIAVAGAGLKTAIVDRQDPAAMIAETFDGRASAIAYGSRLVLEGAGVWQAIAAEAEPIREIRVADDD